MNEMDTKTIRITKDTYKILLYEKKKLSNMSNIPYAYSDIILASLAVLDVLAEKQPSLVLELLREFKRARIDSRLRGDKIREGELFQKVTKNLQIQLSSEFLKDAIIKIIKHLIERGFPGAAMEVLLDNVNIFDEHERNQLSFEILAAMANKAQPGIKENLEKKLEKQ